MAGVCSAEDAALTAASAGWDADVSAAPSCGRAMDGKLGRSACGTSSCRLGALGGSTDAAGAGSAAGTAASSGSARRTVGACNCGRSRGTLGASAASCGCRSTCGAGCAGNGTASSSDADCTLGACGCTSVSVLGASLGLGGVVSSAICGALTAGGACACNAGKVSEVGDNIG
jgi:hypothetical protein